jgi:hypothetical protein
MLSTRKSEVVLGRAVYPMRVFDYRDERAALATRDS